MPGDERALKSPIVIAHLLLLLVWALGAAWVHGIIPTVLVVGLGLVFGVIIFNQFAKAYLWVATGVLLVVIGASWIFSGNNSILALVILLGAIPFLVAGYRDSGDSPRLRFMSFVQDWQSLVFWIIAFALIFYGVVTSDGAYLADPMHPTYERSIGNSFALGLLKAPDLSLVGRQVQFHPLTTQLTRVFELFGIHTIESIYFVTPCVLATLLYFALVAVYAEHRVLQFFSIALLAPILVPENILRRFFLLTPSYTVSCLFMLAAVFAFTQKKDVLFLISAIAVVFAKASFFPVIVGALALWGLVQRTDRRRAWLLSIALAAAAVPIWLLFYRGAHPHNHWLIGPSFLYDAIQGRDVAGPIWFVVILLAGAIRGFWDRENRDFLAAVFFSGIIGTLLLHEATEGNSGQFLIAAYPFVPVVLLRRCKTVPKFVQLPVIGLCVYSVATVLVPHAVVAMEFAADRGPFSSFLAGFESPPIFTRYEIEAYTWVRENVDEEAVVFFSKHHEMRESDHEFWPHTGFLRSAISDRQMVLENLKYKGVVMDKRFPELMGTGLAWYGTHVMQSDSSERQFAALLGYLGSSWDPVAFDGNANEIGYRLLYFAGLGKRWSFLNIRPRQYRLTREVYESSTDTVVAPGNADCIVLEDGDQMAEGLEASWRLVFSNVEVRIYRRAAGYAGQRL